MDLTSNYWCPYKEKYTSTHKEESHVTKEAEIGLMHVFKTRRAKDC